MEKLLHLHLAYLWEAIISLVQICVGAEKSRSDKSLCECIADVRNHTIQLHNAILERYFLFDWCAGWWTHINNCVSTGVSVCSLNKNIWIRWSMQSLFELVWNHFKQTIVPIFSFSARSHLWGSQSGISWKIHSKYRCFCHNFYQQVHHYWINTPAPQV